MARDVGEISVRVSTNTGHLVAELNAAGKESGRAYKTAAEREMKNLQASIDFQTEQVKTEAKFLRKQIEAQLSGIELGVDIREAIKDLEEMEAVAKNVDLVLNAAVSDRSIAQINSQLKTLKEGIEADAIQFEADLTQINIEVDSFLAKRREAEIQFEADLSQININLERFRAQQELNAINLRLDTDLASIQAGIETLRQEQEHRRVNINLNPDIAGANARIAAWRREQEANAIEVPVKADTSGMDLGLGRGQAAKWIAGIAVLGDAAASALSGTLAAATSVISSAIFATGAAALAATPIVAGFGAALTAGIVGAKGFGDALDAVNAEFEKAAKEGRPVNRALIETSAAFAKLSPAARDTALAFADLHDDLNTVRRDVQQQLFRGLAQEMQALSRETIPDISDALEIAAGSVNEFARGLAQIARQTDFAGTMEALDPALDDAFDSAKALVRTLEPFLKAAAPAAERLAEMIERGAEGLELWVKNNPDEIGEFLDNGLTSLKQWASLLQSTGDLLGTIFEAGRASGDGFVTSLNNIIERWDGWLEGAAGQTALTEFFESGHEAMVALQPVLDGLKESFDVLVTDATMSNFENLAAAIGDALPAIAELITLIGQLQLAAGFANLLAALGPVFDLINNIPGGMMEIVGTAIVVTASLMKIVGALKAIGIASKATLLTSGWLIAIAAAATVAVVAFDKFTGGVDTAEARTRELSNSLADTVDSMIASGDAADSATIGYKALNEALASTGEGSDKLMDAFALINSGAGDATLGIDDTTTTLRNLRGEGDSAFNTLKTLAEGYGLPAGPAAELAEIINNTDDNLSDFEHSSTAAGHRLKELAESSGIPRDRLVALAGAIEEVQDQAEDTDLDVMVQAFLDTVSTGTEAEQAILAKAEADQKAGKIAEGVVPLFDAVTAALNDQAHAHDDSTSSALSLAESYVTMEQAAQDSLVVIAARKAELEKERKAAMDAWKEEVKLGDATERAAVQIAEGMGVSRDYAEGLVDLGESMRDAAEEADALTSALDLLLSPSLNVQETFSNLQQGVDDLDEALKGGADATKLREDAVEKMAEGDTAAANALNAEADALEKTNRTLDLSTEAGRENAEVIRNQISGIAEHAAAMLASGEANQVVADTAIYARESLIQQAEGFFTTSDAAGTARQQAENYIDQLGLTPELITTVFQQPNLVNALLNAEDLTLLYDQAGNPVITEFEALGIDPAMAQTEGFKLLVEGLNTVRGEPTIETPTVPDVTEQVEGVETAVGAVDEATADPTLTVSTAPEVQKQLDTLRTTLSTLNLMTASPKVTLPTYTTVTAQLSTLYNSLINLPDATATVTVNTAVASNALSSLQTQLDNIKSKTVTVTVNTNNIPGGMAGAMIRGPQLMNVGERGYAEALVPLQLPLSRINPEVRHLAELIRGGGSSGSGGEHAARTGARSGPNITQHFTLASADPGAVATQIINRSATLANR